MPAPSCRPDDDRDDNRDDEGGEAGSGGAEPVGGVAWGGEDAAPEVSTEACADVDPSLVAGADRAGLCGPEAPPGDQSDG